MIKTILNIIICILIFHSSFGQKTNNQNLDSIVKEYKKLSFNGTGISKEENLYSKKIQKFGQKAIPTLLKMLKDDELEIRIRFFVLQLSKKNFKDINYFYI